jgi:chemotaxis protein CheD
MLNIETLQEVYTGEVRTTRRAMLVSHAIGSCIAVMMIDEVRQTGGIAHVMLPGKAQRAQQDHCLRYAENAIEELIRQMKDLGSRLSDIVAVLAGGGNVLRRPDDTICSMNICSVLAVLKRRGVPVAASSLGGTERRKVRLDLSTRRVFQALGDGGEQVLWQAVYKGNGL